MSSGFFGLLREKHTYENSLVFSTYGTPSRVYVSIIKTKFATVGSQAVLLREKHFPRGK